MNKLTEGQVAAIVAKREAGTPRAQIAEEVGVSRSVVYVALTAKGKTRAPAATRAKYRKVMARMLEAGSANGLQPKAKAKPKAKPKPRRKPRAKAAAR